MANEEAKQKKQAEVGVSQQPMAAGSETTKKWSQLVAQAWADQKLKQRLLDDPKAVLREQGIKVLAGVEVRVVEPTDKLLYFVLPPKPADAGELTSSQLSGIAGGTTITAGGSIELDKDGNITKINPGPSGCLACAFY